MHVFRIMQNVQEKFESGILDLHVLIRPIHVIRKKVLSWNQVLSVICGGVGVGVGVGCELAGVRETCMALPSTFIRSKPGAKVSSWRTTNFAGDTNFKGRHPRRQGHHVESC